VCKGKHVGGGAGAALPKRQHNPSLMRTRAGQPAGALTDTEKQGLLRRCRRAASAGLSSGEGSRSEVGEGVGSAAAWRAWLGPDDPGVLQVSVSSINPGGPSWLPWALLLLLLLVVVVVAAPVLSAAALVRPRRMACSRRRRGCIDRCMESEDAPKDVRSPTPPARTQDCCSVIPPFVPGV